MPRAWCRKLTVPPLCCSPIVSLPERPRPLSSNGSNGGRPAHCPAVTVSSASALFPVVPPAVDRRHDCCTLKTPPQKSLRSFVCCATKSVWYGHKPMLLPPAITRTQDTEAMALFTASAEAAMDNGEDEMAEFYAAAAAAVNEASL